MSRISIIKTGKYNPIYNELSKYESLDLITTFRYSPGIVDSNEVILSTDANLIKNINLIIHSSLKRTQETAQAIQEKLLEGKAKMLETNLLNEIKFSLKDLVDRTDYEKQGSNFVRQRFIEAFIKDSLLEKKEQIFTRIKNLGNLLKNLNDSDHPKILCISHSFFMKVLQIYLTDYRLFNKPEILAQHFDPFKRTFEFCQGFEFDRKDLF